MSASGAIADNDTGNTARKLAHRSGLLTRRSATRGHFPTVGAALESRLPPTPEPCNAEFVMSSAALTPRGSQKPSLRTVLAHWAFLGALLLGLLGCRGSSRHEPGAALREPTPKPAATEDVTSQSTRGSPTAAPSNEDRTSSSAPLVNFSFTTGGASPDAPLPWIVALHGLGDRPEAFSSLLRDLPFQAHVHVPRAPLAHGGGYDWFGVRVSSGDIQRLSEAIRAAALRVVRLIEVLAEDPRHVGKPMVTGFSQGGMLSFALGVHHSKHISASFPIAGWLPPPLWPSTPVDPSPGGDDAANLIISALHGGADEVVPSSPTLAAILHLIELGYDARIEVEPGTGHIPSETMLRTWREDLAKQHAALSAAPR